MSSFVLTTIIKLNWEYLSCHVRSDVVPPLTSLDQAVNDEIKNIPQFYIKMGRKELIYSFEATCKYDAPCFWNPNTVRQASFSTHYFSSVQPRFKREGFPNSLLYFMPYDEAMQLVNTFENFFVQTTFRKSPVILWLVLCIFVVIISGVFLLSGLILTDEQRLIGFLAFLIEMMVFSTVYSLFAVCYLRYKKGRRQKDFMNLLQDLNDTYAERGVQFQISRDFWESIYPYVGGGGAWSLNEDINTLENLPNMYIHLFKK